MQQQQTAFPPRAAALRPLQRAAAAAAARLAARLPGQVAIRHHDDHAVLTHFTGEEWRVADLRAGEDPRTFRCPPDPEATHRVFWRVQDALRAVADLELTRPVLRYNGIPDGSAEACALALEHALDRTSHARERLEH